MSSFICPDQHLAYIAQAAERYVGGPIYIDQNTSISTFDTQKIIEMLYTTNRAGYVARYPRDEAATPKKINTRVRSRIPITPVQTLKACDAYEYQCAEFEGYEEHIGMKICNRVRQAAIRALAGYGEARYTIDE
jgi:hypothetical protein